MFTDKVELKDFEKQDPEYQDLLRRVLAIQADCEIGGPNLYVKDILPNAPTKLDQLIVARTAAEEMDHFRKMARLAGDIGVDVSYTLSRPNKERYVEAFRGQITTWEDYAVFGFLIDRVGRFQLEEFIGATYLPLARVVEDPEQGGSALVLAHTETDVARVWRAPTGWSSPPRAKAGSWSRPPGRASRDRPPLLNVAAC